MIDIRPFRPEDLDSSTENTFWFENPRSFDDSKRLRRHYVATDASQVVGYGCLEQASDDSETLRVLVVCSPANLRGQVGSGLYLRLFEDARELGATTLWAREYQSDENIREFLSSRAFVEGRSFAVLNHAPIVTYKVELHDQVTEPEFRTCIPVEAD